MQNKKIYIAGKITGDENYRAKFAMARERLRKNGGIVLNPAELPEGMTNADYMRVCFAMIDTADLVVLLPGFEQSKGAMLEYDYCAYTGKRTVRLCEIQ